MRKQSLLVAAFFFAAGIGAAAQDIRVVIPQLSPAATDTYTKIVQAIADVEGKKINVQVLPFARAVYLIENKQADLESTIVQIPDKKKWSALKYDYSSSSLAKIVFVLYTNKAKPISVEELKSGNPKKYKIETDAGHVDHFPFACLPSTNVEGSLKKLEAGTIDGFVFAQGTTDGALKRLGIKNIHRQQYDTLSAVFMLQKGARGGPIDAMITHGLEKLKANGKFNEIMSTYIAGASNYSDWQP